MPDTQTPTLAALPPLADAMTARDVQAHETALSRLLGSKGHAHVSCTDWNGNAYIALYEDYPGGDSHPIYGDTWKDAIEAAYAWCATRGPIRRDTLIRRLALAIIETKDDHGAVTERLLTARGFTTSEIAEYGAAACARAGELCAGAPFEIEVTP